VYPVQGLNVEQLRHAFEMFDEDGNGEVSEKEFRLAMKSLIKDASEEEVRFAAK